MTGDYERRITRAGELTAALPESAEILEFYRLLTDFQKTVFERFRSTGETRLEGLWACVPRLRALLAQAGPAELKTFAASFEGAEAMVERYWAGDRSADAEEQFFARTLVQPYAEYLASRGHFDTQSTASVCPFCGARPVAGVLRGEGEGAKRSLICSVCATEWPFRRVVCLNCGEEDKEKLPVFIAAGTDYVRIEACDSCGCYLKSVDLTKNGHAVPVVDELATVALNIWADEHNYAKAEVNLLGM